VWLTMKFFYLMRALLATGLIVAPFMVALVTL
jgi:hypothetical protein